MQPPLQVTFVAGPAGPWRIDSIQSVIGDTLPHAARLALIEQPFPVPQADAAWALRGTTSNTRYTTRPETEALAARQQGLNRPQALNAALIPIRKNDAWWALAQDERRHIIEEQSRHIRIGLDYLPAVSRRLHHCRELGEPFDFLTWFEFAPEHTDTFDEMLMRLRATEEWRYVEREVDIRLKH